MARQSFPYCLEARNNLTATLIRERLDYNPDSGELTWKHNPAYRDGWNTRFAGKVAGFAHSEGYVRVALEGRIYLAHRIAWFHFHGECPKDQIDHINGNRADNRIVNLREATNLENMYNSAHKNPQSGIKGVHFHKKYTTRPYRAHITISGKMICIGRFDTKEEASGAYLEMAKSMHGEFFKGSR